MQHRTDPIIVIGESLMDVVVSGTQMNEHPGGSPMNVAVGLSRLGLGVELLTRIGEDARGVLISTALDLDGVRLSVGSITSEPTSTATATLDSHGSATYEFDIVWGIDSVSALPSTPIVHTGSIAAFLEPGASRVISLLSAVDPETIITFDPNIRPSIIGSKAEAESVVTRLAALATIVKMSDEDLEWLYGTVGAEAGAERMLAAGATLAIVTLGAAGALLATAENRVVVPGVVVPVADTIGAGDSFMSGLISQVAALLEEGTPACSIIDGSALTGAVLTRIGSFAVKCAAVTVSRVGSNPPRIADLA